MIYCTPSLLHVYGQPVHFAFPYFSFHIQKERHAVNSKLHADKFLNLKRGPLNCSPSTGGSVIKVNVSETGNWLPRIVVCWRTKFPSVHCWRRPCARCWMPWMVFTFGFYFSSPFEIFKMPVNTLKPVHVRILSFDCKMHKFLLLFSTFMSNLAQDATRLKCEPGSWPTRLPFSKIKGLKNLLESS